MLERLVQAAFITFLLQIIAVLSNTTPIQPKAVSPISQIPAPIISSSWQISK
ncbi:MULTISPECIES: hypothetical protein [unclassified Anabaena]|uniref:hypothetical protein n=1 Tax=unclassified Anabaena TaxID=2619674 RepID=UPI001448256E|nr:MULTISPECIES: hypothetical protein [unclassified Anabaena]